MTYSKYFFPQDKKIPIPVTIVVVLLLIYFLTKFFSSTSIPSRASKKIVKKLSVVSPSQNQVGIFWQTDEKETGWLIFGQNKKALNNVALDERDLQSKRNLFYNHLVFLKNLQPDTRYFYKIVSNNQLIGEKDGTAFSFLTPSNLTLSSNLNPAYGKVIRENGAALENAIVILSFDKAYSLVALSKTTGEWLLPLNLILNKSRLNVQTVNQEDKLLIEILADDKKKTQITADLASISPLPQTVIIGKNYTFLSREEVLSASAVNKNQINKIDILFPKESAVIPGDKPLIKGTAIPGNEVQISIDLTKNFSFKTTANQEGVWSIVLSEQLSPGTHTLKVNSKDENEKNVQLIRNFVIAKSGEQVLGEATAEATPTIIPSNTPFPALSPTAFASPYLSPTMTTTPSPPTSGINVIPVGVASASLIILGIGILLAF